jgi:hypothetical protein
MNLEYIEPYMCNEHDEADLSAYFDFVEEHCSETRVTGWHKHHVAPRAVFPELEHDEDNWCWLTLEDHIEAHRLLAEAVPECLAYRHARPTDVLSGT